MLRASFKVTGTILVLKLELLGFLVAQWLSLPIQETKVRSLASWHLSPRTTVIQPVLQSLGTATTED